MLEDVQIERYSRQIILPQVGGKGQEKLLRSQVYVDGDGLLAAAALLYLVAAGVGTIGVARAKAAPLFSVLAEQSPGPDEPPVTHALKRLNPDCTLVTHPQEPGLSPVAGDEHPLHQYDLALATTAALHDGWYAQRKPFVWGAASRDGGRLFVSRADRADRPCLRCLFPEHPWVPADPDDSSPLSPPYAFFLGTQLVTEVLKIILQPEADRPSTLLAYTFPAFHCTEQTVKKNPHCPVCSTQRVNVSTA